MKLAYVDCIAGVSGDMLLGALVDAGVPADELRRRLAALELPGFELALRPVRKRGIAALQAEVTVTDRRTERHLPEIVELVERSAVPAPIRRRARAIFERLGEVEAAIHGTSVERVHLHELGGIDTIVDVVGVLTGFELLGAERVECSPLPLGRGFVDSAHGRLPVPAPATVALLEGVPIAGSPVDGELVTPTGAALVTALAAGFGALPAMTLSATGYGAGRADRAIPNVVRLLVGERVDEGAAAGPPSTQPATLTTLTMLETNIDDMNPELYEYVSTRLSADGALEVFTQPAAMKKNRPGTLLSVLCRPRQAAALRRLLFRETTTIGVREYAVARHALERETRTVATRYGALRVKVVQGEGLEPRWAPEYEDCRRLAEQSGAPLQAVYQAGLTAAEGCSAAE